MKYYNKQGTEISKSTFYRMKRKDDSPVACIVGKTGTGETYKRLTK